MRNLVAPMIAFVVCFAFGIAAIGTVFQFAAASAEAKQSKPGCCCGDKCDCCGCCQGKGK